MGEEFNPINTKEDFDAAVAPLLQAEREKYSDYDSIKATNTTLQGQLTDRDKTITELRRTAAALKAGLPAELASRLTGETEADFDKDAAALAKLIGQQKREPEPARDYEPAKSGGKTNSKTADYRGLLDNLNLGGN